MMKLWLFVLFLAFADAIRSKKVLQLSKGNFNDTILAHPLVMVSFNAPWCAHCKKLMAELGEVAEDLIEMDIEAKVATFDVSLASNAGVAEHEGVIAYPTLLVYKNGVKSNEYHGNRAQKDIVQYLRHKASPAVRRITSLSEVLPYLDQFESGELQETGHFSIVLGLFTTPEEGDTEKGIEGRYAAIFNNTASVYDLALFFYTDDAAVLQQLNVQTDSLVVFQELPDETHEVFPFTPELSVPGLVSYLLEEALPLSVPYAPETLSTISFHPVKSHVLMFTNTSAAADSFTDLVESVALDYKGRLVFIEINPEEYQLAAYFGLKTHQLPQLVIANMTDSEALRRHHLADYLHSSAGSMGVSTTSGGASKLLEGGHSMIYAEHGSETALPYTSSQLRAFFDAYLAHSLSPRLLSEAETDMERLNDHTMGGYMENIAGSQFQAKVVDQVTHNSFVFFHAPWCAHCKSLEPVVSEVGRHYLEDPNFMLYRIDGTKNDVLHQGVRIAGYPTLYFFPAHGKQSPLEYDGERTTEAIIAFIDAFKQGSHAEGTERAGEESGESGGDGDSGSAEGEVGLDGSAAEGVNIEQQGYSADIKNSDKVSEVTQE